MTTATTTNSTPVLEINTSRQFTNWMHEQNLSLALTTYQAGKLFLLGLQPDGRLSIFERTFNRCLGLWSDGQTMWMTSLYQLWRFENVLDPGLVAGGYDRLYVPQVGYTTGDLDIHDVAVSMPHSPRVYRNKLWLLNSGTGHFGYINRMTGKFEPVVFCPGYLRGLSFHGDYAIVGLSRPRENKTFLGLQLDD